MSPRHAPGRSGSIADLEFELLARRCWNAVPRVRFDRQHVSTWREVRERHACGVVEPAAVARPEGPLVAADDAAVCGPDHLRDTNFTRQNPVAVVDLAEYGYRFRWRESAIDSRLCRQRTPQDGVFLERGERATVRRGDDEVADAERQVGVVGNLDVGDRGAGVASRLMRGNADLILPARQLQAPEQP